MNGTLQSDKGALLGTFSQDSLDIGESTRSLLTPVYGDAAGIEEPDFSEGSLSSDSDRENELPRHSKQGSKDYSLEFEIFNSSTDRSKSTTPRNSSPSRSKRSSSKTTRSLSKSSTERRRTKSASGAEYKEKDLSPWESWLVKKSAENREKVKQQRLQNRKEREEKEIEQRKREEELKRGSEVIAKWLENKRKTSAEERKKKLLQEQLEEEKKESSNRFIAEKATMEYNHWLERKKAQEKEKKRMDELEARVKKEKEVQRKLDNEEAYSRWIAKANEKPKSVYNSFGYTGGMMMGFYEWGSYPAPSYCNPVPWVPPKVKRNNERRKGKMEMIPPSPPLLFRDIENRKAKGKNKT